MFVCHLYFTPLILIHNEKLDAAVAFSILSASNYSHNKSEKIGNENSNVSQKLESLV